MADAESTEIAAPKPAAKKKTSKKAAKGKPKKTSKKTSKKTAGKKTSKKAKPSKKTSKKASEASASSSVDGPWTKADLAKLEEFKEACGSEPKCAKAIGASLGGLRNWLHEGQVPRAGSIAKIRAAIAKGPSAEPTTRRKPGPKPKAASNSGSASEALATSARTKRSKAGTGGRPREGVSLLAMAIVEQDWNLVRLAYDLLR